MKILTSSSLFASLLLCGATMVTAKEVSSLSEAFAEGDASLFLRYRLELVDQNGFDRNATASTLLSKLSYKTATFKGFSGHIEGTHTAIVGADTFSSTVNGNVTRPVVADPELTELNQAFLSYQGKGFAAKVGRQGINLDNQRFVGTVGFRQNDQTYDSILLSSTPTKGVTATYAYAWNVNRIFGNDHPLGDFDANIQMLNGSYKASKFGKLTAYAYLIDINDAPAFGLSSKTFGVRFAGKQSVSDSMTLGYELEYAKQSDYKANPADYSADYYHLAATLSNGGVTVSAGYEVLGSDNGVSFKTPLATLHKFNGWADKFLGTPAAGLQDFYASAAYKVPGQGPLGGLLLKAVYHDFGADVGGADYGTELDLLVSKKVSKHLTASVKAAFYSADTHATDTDKIWFTLQAKF